MNVIRYEQEIRKDADKMHAHAQSTGLAEAYERAAQLYERCGDFEQARVCYNAAAIIRNAGTK